MTQLQINTARLGIITVISHSCSHRYTLMIGVKKMANRKKKLKPRKNSNVNKKNQHKPLVIIQERTDNKAAWMIFIAEILKFLTLLWTEFKEQLIEFFSQL